MSKLICCVDKANVNNDCEKGYKTKKTKSQHQLQVEKQHEQQKTEAKGQLKTNRYSNEVKASHNMTCYRLKLLTYNKVAEQLPQSITPSIAAQFRRDQKTEKSIEKREREMAIKDISKMKEICEQLNCPQISYQIEKLTAAQEELMRMQHRELFDRFFGPGFLCFCPKKNSKRKEKKMDECIDLAEFDEILEEEEELICSGSEMEIMELPPENEWHGFFRGYEILSECTEFSLDELKKCIELDITDTVASIEVHLRAGVRCFIIDLFKGNTYRSQLIVVRFRQSELNVAKELGFPITSTLFARLSPRLQYTGYLTPPCKCLYLYENDCVVMTTDRFWASRCSKHRIFVNARYLLPDVHNCDVLLIGTEIQVVVVRVMEDCFRCKVLRGGKLYSRMPVLFHSRCDRFRMSYCELEDITFVKEVGISVIVSDILGTKSYFDNLYECLKLLKCEHLRIFACVTLNNIDDDESNVEWAKDAYDGFLGEMSLFTNGCGGDGNTISIEETETTRILYLNPQIRQLIEAAHRAHKPFIFDTNPLITGQYVMDPESYKLVLYHPDKYLFSSSESSLNWFFMLANALGADMPLQELNSQLPYCDVSHTGSDSLALSTAAASIEMNATCIFVVGHTGRMATKIASFRPRATIYFISGLKSAANFISIHYNVIMLYYNTKLIESSHEKSVYTQFLFGLSYALKLKSLKHGDHVIFVYGQKPGQLFLDKYVAYKFDENDFVRELARILF